MNPGMETPPAAVPADQLPKWVSACRPCLSFTRNPVSGEGSETQKIRGPGKPGICIAEGSCSVKPESDFRIPPATAAPVFPSPVQKARNGSCAQPAAQARSMFLSISRKEETALALQCDAAVGVHHQHLAVAAHHIEAILLEVEAEGAQYGAHGVLCHEGGSACDVVLQHG